MGYVILNCYMRQCLNGNSYGYERYHLKSNKSVFFTTDINVAFQYKEVLERLCCAGIPFTVVEHEED